VILEIVPAVREVPELGIVPAVREVPELSGKDLGKRESCLLLMFTLRATVVFSSIVVALMF